MASVTTTVTGATHSICSAHLAIYKFYKLKMIIKDDEYIGRSRALKIPLVRIEIIMRCFGAGTHIGVADGDESPRGSIVWV